MLRKLVQEFHEHEAKMLEAQAAMDGATRDALQGIAASWLTKFWGPDGWREILLLNPQYRIDIEARAVSVLIPFDWSELAPCVFQFFVKGPAVHQVVLSLVASNTTHERLILVSPRSEDVPEMYRTQFLRALTENLDERRREFEARNEKKRLEEVQRARPAAYGLGNLTGIQFAEAVDAMRAAGATQEEIDGAGRQWNAARAKVMQEQQATRDREMAQAAARRDVLDWLDRARPVAHEAADIFEVYYRSAVPVKFATVGLDYAVSTENGTEVRSCRALMPDDGDLSGDTFYVSEWMGWQKKTFRNIVSVSAAFAMDGKEEDRPDTFYPYMGGGVESGFAVPVVRNRLLEMRNPNAWPAAKELLGALKWPRLSDGFENKYAPYFGDLRGFVNGLIYTWGTEQQQ